MQENSNDGTESIGTTGASVIGDGLVSDLGGLPSTTDGSDLEITAAGVSGSAGDAIIDGTGPSVHEHFNNDFEHAIVVEEPRDYTPGWPKVYTHPSHPVPMLSYFEKLPEGAELAGEVTNDHTVSDVLELARQYGFPAKSILNHMVHMGYEFRSQDEANQHNQLDF